MSELIRVTNLSKRFGSDLILNAVNFTVNKGEIVGLLGPNGAGKTTFIRLLNGVINFDQGSISIGGYDPVTQGEQIRKITGIVTESAGLYHQMSGLENLQFFAGLYRVNSKEEINRLLNLFDLDEHKDKLVGTYSTGMKKRLGLAKALLHNPQILFLDEPTNGLDPEGINMVLSYLKKYNREKGTTIVICSHVLHQLETICDSFAFLVNGTIVEQGSLSELEDKFVKDVQVSFETSISIGNSNTFLGFPCEKKDKNMLMVNLPDKQNIPIILKEILKTHPVYSVRIENNNLDSIYFSVREENHG